MERHRVTRGASSCNAVLDNVVALAVFVVAVSFDGLSAPHLRVWPMGATASLDGGPHLCFPSDARSWYSIDGSFPARRMLLTKTAELLPHPSVRPGGSHRA